MFQLPQSKIKFGALFFFAGLMLTASCTQNIKNDASISPGKSQAIIFYTANRYLELEPCGCEINPRGGLEREWTLRQLWQSQLKPGNHWVFGNGTTFIPENYDPKRQALYDVKSKYLVEAYNALETSALGLSPEDFNSGIEKMRSLAAAAKFPFVTSNILDKATHRPVFAPFIELDHGRVLVLSVAGGEASAGSGIEVLNPRNSVGALLKSLAPKKYGTIILLSALAADEEKELLDAYPEINLVLSPSAYDNTAALMAYRANTVSAHLFSQARMLMRLDIEYDNPQTAWYNANSAVVAWERLRDDVQDLHELNSARPRVTHPKKSRRNTASLKQEIEKRRELVQDIARLRTIPLNPDPGLNHYAGRLVELSSQLADSGNPMAKLVARYKNEVHDRALESKEDETTNIEQKLDRQLSTQTP